MYTALVLLWKHFLASHERALFLIIANRALIASKNGKWETISKNSKWVFVSNNSKWHIVVIVNRALLLKIANRASCQIIVNFEINYLNVKELIISGSFSPKSFCNSNFNAVGKHLSQQNVIFKLLQHQNWHNKCYNKLACSINLEKKLLQRRHGNKTTNSMIQNAYKKASVWGLNYRPNRLPTGWMSLNTFYICHKQYWNSDRAAAQGIHKRGPFTFSDIYYNYIYKYSLIIFIITYL